MNTKTLSLPQCVVEFFAATPRLADAYRRAAQHNRTLARFAKMRVLQSGSTDTSKLERVVLSHVDESNLFLTDQRMVPLISDAFHLLFTEPATHPDQVAQWMRSTKIRSENRLHVVRVENLDDPEVSQLLGRVCFALGRDNTRGSIIDAYLAGDTLFVRGPKHRMLHVPLSSLKALHGQTREVLRNFVIDPDGSFLHWPDIDVHLGWNQFLQAIDPEELRKAQQKIEGYNKRYGAAIRKIREKGGIPQSKIAGLTERQLRRIEQGECRATKSALDALARAHGVDTGSYMEQVAKAMKP